METDALIEQLAFGKSTPKLSKCLGIYLSPEVVYLSEVHFAKGKVAVDHMVRVPVPAPEHKSDSATSPTLVTEFLGDTPRISALIRQAISQMRWNSTDVVVTLSHHLGLLRYFTMPAVERRFWKSAIPLEAKKYIPMPLETLAIDYQVEPMPPGPDNKSRQATLVAVAPSKNLPSIAALMSSLGLKIVGIEVAPCSVMRLWNTLDAGKVREPYCHTHFDGGNVRVLIADKGLPVFFREAFLGPEAYVSDARKVDLGGCVAFAQKQLSVGNMSQLRISGSTPELAGWKDALGQEVGMPVDMQDTAGQLGIKGGDWGGYASIGAGLRYIAPSKMTLELSPIGKIGEGERLAVKYILALSMAAALLVCLLAGAKEFSYRMASREFSKYTPDPELESLFKEKSPDDIQLEITTMQELSEGLPDFAEMKKVKLVPILRAIVDALPEKVWLSKINVTNPIKAGAAGGREIRLSGNSMGASPREEQEKALLFKTNISRSPILSGIFDEFLIDVTQAPSEDGASPPPASDDDTAADAFKRRLEQRTSFELTIRIKKKTPG
ncbi:MAG: pilus assembly protein PilM [Elusimicrobia bacterium]|nr:pilus assembly protein PilM [Elusimicrobiota bacterium]